MKQALDGHIPQECEKNRKTLLYLCKKYERIRKNEKNYTKNTKVKMLKEQKMKVCYTYRNDKR